jgi:hypothetical protein
VWGAEEAFGDVSPFLDHGLVPVVTITNNHNHNRTHNHNHNRTHNDNDNHMPTLQRRTSIASIVIGFIANLVTTTYNTLSTTVITTPTASTRNCANALCQVFTFENNVVCFEQENIKRVICVLFVWS